MIISSKVFFSVAIVLLSISANAQSVNANKEWVIVLDDPRPERLKGWHRGQYSGNGHYSNALELKRSGQRLANKHGLATRAEWFIESLGVYCLIAIFNGNQELTLKRLRSDKNVKFVQPSNDFELLQTREASDIDRRILSPPELQFPRSINGAGVVVAMVDSAVDQTHSDIVRQVTENVDFVEDKNKTSTGEAHGTAVAGVIVADQISDAGVTGVASGAKLKAYRGCWESAASGSIASSMPRGKANCSTLSLARALDAVATKGKVDILNLSLSGPKDELLDQLITQIVSQGTRVVIAFDPKRKAKDRFPSITPGIITARATSQSQDQTHIFAAPGEKIVAAPQQQANLMQGHSIASAYTSGILALCVQIEKQLKKKICTASLFERLQNIKTNNVHQLVNELMVELDFASVD